MLKLESNKISPTLQTKIVAGCQCGDLEAILESCRELLALGDFGSVEKLGTWSLAQLGFHPETSFLVGSAHAKHADYDNAYFHLFNSYASDSNRQAGRGLVELLVTTCHFKEAARLLDQLTKKYPDDLEFSALKQRTSAGGSDVAVSDMHREHFVVSYCENTWPRSGSKVFIADPLVHYQIMHSNRRASVEVSKVAQFVRTSPDDMVRCVATMLEKQEKYLAILGPRLSALHKLSMSKEFWRRSLSICFERNIGLVYEMFQILEANFNPAEHFCRILSPDSYHVPLDFDEQRYFLEHWSYGREQMLSCYLEEFYPGNSPQIQGRFNSPYKVREIGSPNSNNPVVGIMGAFFAGKFHNQLIEQSAGRVNVIGFHRALPIDTAAIDWRAREFLTRPVAGFDRFDRFFFRTLKALMPRVFVEYLPQLLGHLDAQFAPLTNLKYVVSEMWIGEAYEPVALALLKETRGVQTIYNEHNINVHPYKASLLPRWASYCDVYAAHGSYGKEIPNVIELGSLYDFGYGYPTEPKQHGITYISGLALARSSDFCSYDTSEGYCEHMSGFYDFKRKFFSTLNSNTKALINYRGYPFDDYLRHWEAYYDDTHMMGDLLNGVKRDDLKCSGKQTIASSKLVIVDYLMTSYLESMFMNIPTIILFGGTLSAFSERYADYLKPLIDVGICYTDPVKAAEFVSKIHENPQQWWSTPEVQRVREQFLMENLGDPQSFLNYLLNLSQSSPEQGSLHKES